MAGYIGSKAVSVNTTSATITGDASIGGNVTLNDGSADVDFRVETNGNANMLFVDGGTDRVGIGHAAPTVPFAVSANPGAVATPVAWLHNSGNVANYDGVVISSVNNGSDAEVLHVRANNSTYANGTSLMLVRGDGNVGIGTSASLTNLSVAGSESSFLSRVNIDVSDNANRTLTLSEQKITFAAPDTYGTNYNAFINYGLTSLQFATANSVKMTINNSGAVTMPLQPAFLAQPSSTQSNLAINTDHDIAFASERFDQGSNFANPNFTAPVDGKYQFNIHVYFNQLDVDGTFYEIKLITTLRTYSYIIDVRPFDADTPNWSFNASVLANMDATDTAKVVVKPYNSGAAQADIDSQSYFSGYLVA